MSESSLALKQKKQGLKNNGIMYALLAPAVIYVFLVTFIPLIYNFYLSFQNYILTKPNDIYFNNFENYTRLFSDPIIRQSILTTFFYTFSSVILTLGIGLGLAVVVNNISFGKTFLRIALFAPMMLSSVVVGVIWRFIFNNELGILNFLVESIGIARVNWLGSGGMAMVSILIADIWQWSSYTFILALAALEAMNPEPVEAARIDGASSAQIFWYLKVPDILPVLEVAAVFRFIWAFRGFDLIFALTKGGPGTSTETMALEVWRLAFTRYDIGTASAVSIVMFVLLFLISIILLRNTMKKS